MDAQVQILQVSVRNTRSGKTVYDVSCSDGKKRQVWESNLANQINSFANPMGQGPVITIRFDQKQNGQYLNESIQAFAGPGQQLPPDANAQAAPMGAMPMGGAMPVAGAQALPAGPPIQQSSGGGSSYTPEVTTRITKLAAYEYAATLVGSLYSGSGPEAEADAIAMLDRVAKHIYSAARSHEKPQGQAQALPAGEGQIQPVATTAQGVADYAAAAGAPVVVGAPVAAAQDAAAETGDVIEWD